VPTSEQNIALLAKASASSAANGQGPDKAIDNKIDGYPGDAYAEWASAGTKVGTTFTLTWSSMYTVDTIVLYDRPNSNDQIWASTVDFSDGTEIRLSALFNDGSATVFSFDPVNTTSLLLTVTAVSPTSASVGLAEFQVYGTLAGPDPDATPSNSNTNGTNIAPLAKATASSASNVQPADRAIDGVVSGYPANYSAEWASDREQAGATLNLKWDQSYTICSVVLYDRPNANDQMTSGTLMFSDGSVVSFGSLANDGSATTFAIDSITMNNLLLEVDTVSDNTGSVGLAEIQVMTCGASQPAAIVQIDSTNNIAPLASIQASSASGVQPADRAIDGVISGYPANYSAEWASNNEGIGATLTLTWSQAYTIGRVVLYDRPNANDQITAGTLTFDDGSTVVVPSLDNAGGATIVNFAPKLTKTLLFTVTDDTSSTASAGLAEIQVYPVLQPSATISASASALLPLPTGSLVSNIALFADVSASSQSYGQEGDSATDGVTGGCKHPIFHRVWRRTDTASRSW